MARKSQAQVRVELKIKDLSEDRKRLIDARKLHYDSADALSVDIRRVEERMSDLLSILDGEPEIIKPKEEKEDEDKH